MKLNQLRPNIKKPARKRRGQGNGTGNGTFAGRGCNGQNARAGGGVRPGFEGGQSGLLMRMPKQRGFRNPNRVVADIVQTAQLEAAYAAGEIVSVATLLEKKLISGKNAKVKILNDGEVTKSLTVEGVLVSGAAKTAIEKAGGIVK